MTPLRSIKTPAYVADIAAIKRNMAVAERIKAETGVKILLATKAFSMFSVFPFMKDTLDGTTASGLYEARLGATHFGPGEGTHTPPPLRSRIYGLALNIAITFILILSVS